MVCAEESCGRESMADWMVLYCAAEWVAETRMVPLGQPSRGFLVGDWQINLLEPEMEASLAGTALISAAHSSRA